jgi:hypothetical protein
MGLARDMRERALILLQISQESEQFKEQAAYLAREWLMIASLRERFIVATQAESEAYPRN